MRKYRLILVLKSDIKKEEKQKLLDDVKKWAGKISEEKVEEIGEKKFAYTIKHEKKGDYVMIRFSSERVEGDLEKRILMQNSVLRHLLIRD
ncbi:30S ribosomal protein S6 [Candidatus Parcubacteria bacterium]|nr:MAG: 30S ribosomal protein S6 [Candidatus Parcubacteria bacterium]